MVTNETNGVTPQTHEPAHDENSALVEAFKMGLNMASQSKAAPVIEEPKPKYPAVTDNGTQAAGKRQRTEIPNIF